MGATDASSPPLATFYDTNEKNRGRRRRACALGAVLNSRARLRETGTWHMTNASRGGHPKLAGRPCLHSTVQSTQDMPVCGE